MFVCILARNKQLLLFKKTTIERLDTGDYLGRWGQVLPKFGEERTLIPMPQRFC